MVKARSRVSGLVVADHVFDVPLDHSDGTKGTIQVFAREVCEVAKKDDDLPWLVFLQGGPGGWSPRPMGKEHWIKVAVKKYRILLLDQRGVGRSTPVTHETLAKFDSPQQQADYLTHFRADNIVRDCELIRKELVGEKWASLGQSYGGFCTLTYLSFAPEGLTHCYITGGVPSPIRNAEDVYRATCPKVIKKNRKFYDRHPGDEEHVRNIVKEIEGGGYTLPNGDAMTIERFRQLGQGFGMMEGFDALHYMLETAFVDGKLSHSFLTAVQSKTGFDTGPIFAILHEPIYCQGEASGWAADRVRDEFLEFGTEGRFTFIGEMIGRWMFDQIGTLRPLKEAAEILAEKDDWPHLYDVDRLRKNEVPVVCAVYHDDMYVPAEFSLECAEMVPNVRCWVTNEFEHCGLRTESKKVLGRLMDMISGEVLSP